MRKTNIEVKSHHQLMKFFYRLRAHKFVSRLEEWCCFILARRDI